MKRLLLTTMLALPLCLAQTAALAARAPAPPAPPFTGYGPPKQIPPSTPGGSISIHELPSNLQSKVETDRFIGYPTNAFKVWNGLMMRSMLRHGDPYNPGPSGDVLEYRDDLAVATLEPHAESGAADSPAVTYYFVQGGKGRVDTGPGTQSYDLRPNVAVLVAPGTKQHFVNTGDSQLSMIMFTWTNNDGLKVKLPIKVVDTNTRPAGGPDRAHWVMSGKGGFGVDDGANGSLSAILVPPNSYTGPHAHVKGVEEIWVKTGFDVGYAILGSEIRRIDGPGAFLAPPNGLTTHSSMNLNEDHPATWLYLSRRAPQPAAPAAPARAN